MDFESTSQDSRTSQEIKRRTSYSQRPSSPQQHEGQIATSPPQTIVLGLWPCATAEQIQYYVQGYKTLYSTSRIVTLHHSTAYDHQVGHALDALTSPLNSVVSEKEQTGDPNGSVLLHVFGDDGAANGCRLLRAYRIRTGRLLNVKAIVMDDVPHLALPSWRSVSQSRLQLLAFFGVMLTFLYHWLLSTLHCWDGDRRRNQTHRDLNDPSLVPAEARKCYMFAEHDLMFSWNRVAAAAADDDDGEHERQDYAVKRRSVDGKGRWTGDQERYWLAIENVWDVR